MIPKKLPLEKKLVVIQRNEKKLVSCVETVWRKLATLAAQPLCIVLFGHFWHRPTAYMEPAAAFGTFYHFQLYIRYPAHTVDWYYFPCCNNSSQCNDFLMRKQCQLSSWKIPTYIGVFSFWQCHSKYCACGWQPNANVTAMAIANSPQSLLPLYRIIHCHYMPFLFHYRAITCCSMSWNSTSI